MIDEVPSPGTTKYRLFGTGGEAYSASWCVGNLGCVNGAHVATDGCANYGDLGGYFCKPVRRQALCISRELFLDLE